MRDVSRIRAAAERIRWIGSTVTSARDAEIIEQYARELEDRASIVSGSHNGGPRVFWPHPGFADAQIPMLRKCLKRVFPLEDTARFDGLIRELEGAGAQPG